MMVAGALVGVVVSLVAAAGLRQWAVSRRIVRKVGAREEGPAREAPPVGGLALALGLTAGVVAWQLRGGGAWSPQLLGLAEVHKEGPAVSNGFHRFFWCHRLDLVIGFSDQLLEPLAHLTPPS